MRQKKAKALRKSLGMTKENFRQKDYAEINKVQKRVFFRDANGQLVSTMAVRSQVINTNLNFYRRAKKDLKKRG